MRNYLPQKQYFPSKLPALLQVSIIFLSSPTCCEAFALTDEGGMVLPGLWVQSWLSGCAISAKNWPGIIQAQPSLAPSSAAGSLFQGSTAQVAEKHLLISAYVY